MRVAVGSENPVKRAATERAMGDVATDVVTLDVESGVPEQPWGETETITGAKTRAARARAAGAFDLGVGIEGGVAPVDGIEGLFLVMWAAVSDGSTVGLGSGPRLRLPDRVATRLEDGAELGPVMDDLLDTSGVAANQGAAGVLTDRVITREDALFHAVAGAFGRFASGQYE